MAIEQEVLQLIHGERIDPIMLQPDFFIKDKLRSNNGKRRTPWGSWHTIKIHEARYEFAAETLNIDGQSRVLDLACGTGYGSRFLADGNWFGVDLSFDAVRFGNSHNRKSEGQLFVNANGTRIPLATSSFDAVVSFETMEHIPLCDVPNYLDEVQRVLKPDGKYVMSVPNRDYSYPGTTINDRPADNIYHMYEPNFNELQRMLEPRFEHIDYFFQVGKFLKPGNRIMNRAAKLPRVLAMEFAKVRPIEQLVPEKQLPGVFLAVCSN